MKIILSRKGFDSSFGGYPSPILPDGKMVSLPIPRKDDLRYSDLLVEDGLTYYDVMRQLKPNIKIDGIWHRIEKETKCHLDPDIYRNVIPRKSDWRPCFGQIDSAQRHLEEQGIGEGDLFLFFGWFKRTRNHNGELEFDPNERNLHAIFGYMQIDEIMKITNNINVPEWLEYHPHNSENRRNNKSNTMYIARRNSSWNNNLDGAGNLEFNENLILTKKGLSRTKWSLPDLFRSAEISYHSKDSWKNGYFQSAARGQEFVIKDNKKVEEWAMRLIEGSVLASN